jgi:MFS-type transporter involved in bile tolerance (Atg22 family)
MSGITTTTTTTTTTTNSNTTTNEIDIDISKMDDCNNDTEEQGEQQQQQQQQQQHGDDDGNTSTNIELPKCYPKWKGKPIYDGNPEVLGWTLVSVAESIQYVGSGAFFATTMLRVARDAMTCHEQLAATSSSPLDSNAAVELCGPTFGSINPSSLLSMYAIVVGLVSTAFLPLLGAIVDYTKHRRLIGRVSSTLFVLFQIPTIFLNEKNYPIVLSFHGCAMLIGWIQMSMLFAYLPELTSCEIKLASYTRSITIWTFSGMIIYLVTVVAFVNIIGKGGDDVFTSMVGMATAFGINVIFFSLAWGFLLGKRGPLHERPVTTTTRVVVTSVEDEEAAAAGTEEEVTVTTSKSLYVIGFTQLWGTAKHIVRNYRSLKWFYVSIAFSESAASAFSVIASKFYFFF